jgi:hypothetical protein
MFTKLFYALMFVAGASLGFFVGGWESRKVQAAFEQLKADSRAEAEKLKGVSAQLEQRVASAAQGLAEKEAQIKKDAATFEAEQTRLKRERDAAVAKLRAKADTARASGDTKAADVADDEADGLECMDMPVPTETVRAINKASEDKK